MHLPAGRPLSLTAVWRAGFTRRVDHRISLHKMVSTAVVRTLVRPHGDFYETFFSSVFYLAVNSVFIRGFNASLEVKLLIGVFSSFFQKYRLQLCDSLDG